MTTRPPQAFSSQLFRLEGKTALVTGAVGILGKHFCRGLAEVGANIVVSDLDGVACSAFAQELNEAYGVAAAGVACDITDPAQVTRLVATAVSLLGPIHVLHNNAGGRSRDPTAYFETVENYAFSEWREAMAVNVDGAFLVAQAVGAQMARQGLGGSIVQTGSIYGAMAPDQRIYEGSNYHGMPINTPAVYSASKAAVIGLTRYLATYWAAQGIRVNCICPGGVASGQNDTFVQRYSQRVPLGRMAEAAEMVGALVYLASEASSYVTGQVLMVDGGLSAW